MRCKDCLEEDMLHRVYKTGGHRTLMPVQPGYWDEDDSWVDPVDPNKNISHYNCSNGHTWHEEELE